ncbi:jg12797 [Pararge aegeria aegeria]|uniref:Jg12797 protein n=1 Tax=Pararge aegeria aegeria TaxID=348720 RepID=A0A8S4RLG4_9NEOP|nr:jg12797 [Pararge aegeria aegeria]
MRLCRLAPRLGAGGESAARSVPSTPPPPPPPSGPPSSAPGTNIFIIINPRDIDFKVKQDGPVPCVPSYLRLVLQCEDPARE